MVRAGVPRVISLVTEGEKLLLKNRIFLDRVEGIGRISAEDALALGWTGVCLRSTGVPTTCAGSHPYMLYDRFDFDVPVGTKGDNYDRFMCRHEEIRQSVRIIEQALEQMPDEGPVDIDDPRIVLPPKDEVYTTIEGTIQHFKIVMEGIKVPAGRVLLVHRGRQRRARLLPRLRRQRHALPRAHPPALLRAGAGPQAAHHRAHDPRRRADVRLAQHDRRGVRPLVSFGGAPPPQTPRESFPRRVD